MRLRYTQPALADLDAILEYTADHSLQGAARVHARIQVILELLLSHPNIGVPTDDPIIRRIYTSPYPYLIFSEVAGYEVIVHAIRHGARDPSGMPGTG
jgi:plasmid stabilization system protein ParE